MNTFNQTPRIIKKYGNRRLYDEVDSRYVNFSDLRTLVMEGKQFRVVVEKTNEDQTAKLLLQIFLEMELSGQYLFSDQALRSLIVLNNSPAKSVIDLYLKNMLSFQPAKREKSFVVNSNLKKPTPVVVPPIQQPIKPSPAALEIAAKILANRAKRELGLP